MTRRLLTGVVLLAALLADAATSADPRIAVIVNRERRESLDVPTVAAIYLRKRRFWDDDTPILPVNREANSPLREAFTRRVFGLDSSQLAAYWNEQYFHGVMPPATLSSSESMKRFVAKERDAIGYVELGAADSSVRVALVLE